MSTQIIIPIPYHFKSMAEGSSDPGRLFKRYVAAYVRHNRPGWQLVRIQGMTAVIEKIK